MKEILNKLASTIENPGFYKPLTPEEQAELFLYLFAPKKKVFRKPEVIKGIDGVTPTKDKDYLSKEASEKLISELASKTRTELEALVATKLANVANGRDGKDAIITGALIEQIAALAQSMIVLPDFATLITMEPEAIRDSLELLEGEDRLSIDAIDGLKEKLEEAKNKTQTTAVIARRLDQIGDVDTSGVTNGQTLVYNSTTNTWENGTISGGTDTFETVSKNLDASGATLAYTGDNLTSITYLSGIIKTLNYTGDNLTSVVLSGSTPSGIDLTKTLSYTGDNLTGVSYS